MGNCLIDIFNSDKQAAALFLQAIATILIGILAWSAARCQNVIAEKTSRKELFRMRYINIYKEITNLFEQGTNFISTFNNISEIKGKKKQKEEKEYIIKDFYRVKKKFNAKMEDEQFLIKPRDYDKLKTFCDKFLSHIEDYILEKPDIGFYSYYEIFSCYREHKKIIHKILSAYFYHKNESRLSLYTYKIFKYLKNHILLFLEDYFPVFTEIIKAILLFIAILLGILATIIELIKEILKAEITIKEKKIHFKLKMKSEILKRNRPWPIP